MKKLHILLFIIIGHTSFSQNVTLNELLYLKKQNMVTVEETLSNKGWEYYSPEDEQEFASALLNGFKKVTFAYKKSPDGTSAESFIQYSYDEDWTKIAIQTFEKSLYNSYMAKIKSLGCKLIQSHSSNTGISKRYKGSTKMFTIAIFNDIDSYTQKKSTHYHLEIEDVAYYSAYEHKKNGIKKIVSENYSGAISDFNRSIELDKEDFYSYGYRGLAKNKLGDIQGGKEDIETAQAIPVGRPNLYEQKLLFYANTNMRLNKFREALVELDILIILYENNDNSSDLRGGSYYYLRGVAKVFLRVLQEELDVCSDFKKSADLGYEDGLKSFKEHCY